MLDARQLASMRACCEQAMPDKVVILTAARTSQPAGGWKDDWDNATASDPIDCLLLEATAPGEKVVGGKQVSEVRWIVRLPYGTVVTPKQRLQVNGVIYQILTVPPSQAWSATVDCGCKTLQ